MQIQQWLAIITSRNHGGEQRWLKTTLGAQCQQLRRLPTSTVIWNTIAIIMIYSTNYTIIVNWNTYALIAWFTLPRFSLLNTNDHDRKIRGKWRAEKCRTGTMDTLRLLTNDCVVSSFLKNTCLTVRSISHHAFYQSQITERGLFT